MIATTTAVAPRRRLFAQRQADLALRHGRRASGCRSPAARAAPGRGTIWRSPSPVAPRAAADSGERSADRHQAGSPPRGGPAIRLAHEWPTSRARSPISAITVTSASACPRHHLDQHRLADARPRHDAERWPSPSVSAALMRAHAHVQRPVTAVRASGLTGRSCSGHTSGRGGGRPSSGQARASIARPSSVRTPTPAPDRQHQPRHARAGHDRRQRFGQEHKVAPFAEPHHLGPTALSPFQVSMRHMAPGLAGKPVVSRISPS